MMQMLAFDPTRWGGKGLPGQDELPCEDGEPMETGFHDAQDQLLKDSLIDAWADRKDVFVAGNMFVYFSERQIRSNDFRGPDVFVVLGVEAKGRKSWVAWEEGGRLPDVVIEVTSDSTAKIDYGIKKQIYAQVWRTPAYFIFDPETEKLEGYRLDSDHRQYVAIEPDDYGDFEVAALGLKLGLRETKYRQYSQRFVRWLTPEGVPLPTAQESLAAQRARADELEARLKALEAKA